MDGTIASEPSVAYLSAQAEKAGVALVRATPAAAFRAARAMFDRGEPFDMVALAKKLGIGRATLYRWAGDRERLLADVMWSVAEELLMGAMQAAPGGGAETLALGVNHFVRSLVKSRGVRAIIRNDKEVALRILIRRRDTGVQERAVQALAGIIRKMVDHRLYKPRLDPELLSYSIIRVIEGFVYQDLSVGLEPQLDDLDRVIRALL